MLAVEQHFAALGLGGANAVADRGEVFFRRRLQRNAHMVVPGLGDKADGIGLGFEQCHEAGIVRDRAAGTARHAKRSEGGVEFAVRTEQFGVGRIGARVAAFDIVDAEIVEHAGNRQLVGER